MATDLTSLLDELGPGEFQPIPSYFADGDYLTFYFEDVDCYGERVDELLTIYREMTTDRLVGCKIKGVRRILDEAGKFGVRIEGPDGVNLSFLFLTGGIKKEGRTREQYQELGVRTSDVPLPQELRSVA